MSEMCEHCGEPEMEHDYQTRDECRGVQIGKLEKKLKVALDEIESLKMAFKVIENAQ